METLRPVLSDSTQVKLYPEIPARVPIKNVLALSLFLCDAEVTSSGLLSAFGPLSG